MRIVSETPPKRNSMWDWACSCTGIHSVLHQGIVTNGTCIQFEHTEQTMKKPNTNPELRLIYNTCVPLPSQKRKFGEYKCPKCGRTWSSGNSWEGMGQECMTCRIMVRPHTLRPLKRPDGPENGPPHRSDLCEMCKKLGYNCRSIHSYTPQPDNNAATCNVM